MNAPLPKSIQRTVEAASAAQAALSATPPVAAVDPTASANPVAGDPTQVTPPTDPAPAPKVEDFEQKFRSMQGRYQAALAEAQASNVQMKSQIAQLSQQVEALAAAAKATENTKPAADPRDLENFGADMIEMVQRYADKLVQQSHAALDGTLRSMVARVAKLEDMVSGVSTRTEATLEQQFYAALAAAVPDWEQVNADRRWLDWLAQTDPIYGVPRQAGLDDARGKLDVQRVSAIFNEFKRSLPQKPPAPSLANQVAPNTVASPVPNAGPAPAQIFLAKDVEKFYNDKAKGRIKPEDAARIEAEINRAAAEGRIR